MRAYLLDLTERVVGTYAFTFVGLLLANGADITNLAADKVAAISAIPAALSVIKGVLGHFVGDPNTASVLPQHDRPAG